MLKRGAGACSTRYLSSQQFEKLVVDKIKEHILTTENLKELVRLVNEEMDAASNGCRQRLDVITDEIADANRRLERLYDALETGKVRLEDLSPRIQQLRYRLEQLQKTRYELELQISERRIELADQEIITRYVEDLRNLLSESPLTERKSFIRSFVKEVKVTGQDVLLTYTIPMPPKGITTEEVSVLSTVQNGGRYWI